MQTFFSQLAQIAVRLVFGVAVLVILLGLLALGLVLALVFWLVALFTGRKPRWGVHWQHRAQGWGQTAWRRYGRPQQGQPNSGEVVDAEVREIR